ncbi:hypothetical protein LP419_07000 [Massilia sp. H-1]|nr:hypothetical protein LP419_07000 [Massilia sp. H-1]
MADGGGADQVAAVGQAAGFLEQGGGRQCLQACGAGRSAGCAGAAAGLAAGRAGLAGRALGAARTAARMAAVARRCGPRCAALLQCEGARCAHGREALAAEGLSTSA